MKLSLLLRPDAESWRGDPHYSPSAAHALKLAFSRVASPDATPDDYLAACLVVAPWLDAPMAVPQRVRACCLFARALEAERDYSPALRWVDRALEAATAHPMRGDLIELLAYRGGLERGRGRFRAAANDLSQSLALLYGRAEDADAVDPNLRLELLAQVATYEFFLAHYRTARLLAEEARGLATQATDAPLAMGSVLWVQAHLQRAKGRPGPALDLALTAAVIHERVASVVSQDRMETFVGMVALDLAEQVPGGSSVDSRTPFLDLASVHLRQAERLARQARDRAGQGLVKVALAHEGRLRARNEDRVGELERVLASARKMEDRQLASQVLTEMGRELAAQGRGGEADTCWRDALTALEGTETPALRREPRRALLLAEEMDDQQP